MVRPSTLPVPPFSRSRSMSQSSNHSNSEGTQEHATVAPEEPLLSSTNTPEQLPQSPYVTLPPPSCVIMKLTAATSMTQVRTTTISGHKKHRGRVFEALAQLEETWYIEAFCLLCSAACAILIVTFLAVHDNTQIESWHFYFPITAVVSTLGTVFKSTLLMAVSAALAQGKWTQFQKRSGALSTFQAIDAGSHETFESFRLLWHMRAQHLVSVGALVMALGFMIEPFLQYAISDEGRLINLGPSNTNDTIATIGRSRQLDGGAQFIYTYDTTYPEINTTPDFAISASLYDGLNAALGNGSPNVFFTCISGNCTWPEHVSIAIRSTCFDISDHLKRTSPERSSRTTSGTQSTLTSSSQAPALWTDWTLEHLNLTLSNTNEIWRHQNFFAVLQAAVVADPMLTINFNDSQTLLAAFTIIRADESHTLGSADWDVADASAAECGLELALNVYNSSVVNNVLLEQVVASVSRKVPESWLPSGDQSKVLPDGLKADPGTLESNPIYHDTFLYRNDYALDSAALQRGNIGNFNITQKTLISTIAFLTTLIGQGDNNATVRALQYDQFTEYKFGSPILQPLFKQTNMTATFEAIARSMSNAVRSIGSEEDKIPGVAKQWVRYYQVRWAFLALPLSLITIGVIFFILSIMEAHRVQVPNWKANSIATMVYGPDESLQRHLRVQTHVQGLAVASQTAARLVWAPEGYYLTAADQSVVKMSRPTTPRRDEEEHEMTPLRSPTTPRTTGPNVTPVDPQSIGGAEPVSVRPVSPAFTGPRNHAPVGNPSTSLRIRRTF